MARGLGRLVERWPSLSGERVLVALMRGSAMAIALSAVGQGLGLGLQILFARFTGEAEYGVYSYVMAWFSVGLILGKLGFDTALVRFVASYVSRGRPGFAIAVWNVSRRHSLVSSFIAAPILGCAAWFSTGSGGRSLLLALLLFALLLPIAVVGELAAAALRGLKRIGSAMCADAIVRPMTAAALFGSMAFLGAPTAVTAMSAYAGGTVIGAATTIILLRQALPTVKPAKPRRRLARMWVSSAATLMVANAFLVLMYTVDTILLGALESTTSAGLYSVASKIAILVLFVMNAIQAIGGPLLAEAYTGGRTAELRRVTRMLNVLSSVSAIPVAAALALGAESFLGVFGEGFKTAASVLQILVLMQVLNVLTGPVGVLMSMTGRQRDLALLLAAGLAVHVLLCLVLIPLYGAIGAAWSAFAAHAIWNIAGAVIFRRVSGIDCSVLDWLRKFEREPAVSRGA